ncbi:Protein of unknown function [Andreprevotia lacus DSM 23236]|jgi:uncharacterized protein (DUF2384 family)|uniref:Antitoxin Xre/MbcA/ParS-like toxin-binding domain-containing protein n=1 Tax=Andreprevotia lacus DSM 23236 TaxID=1121001 RepID=A0A1W1XZS4_9NEIS|nr:MbcA/ParS/Xre antitoxin family protein [Andreprevotia lacus]SMC29413.1 Protein of unknown function [Andreprevotia lacus DSM 23236]
MSKPVVDINDLASYAAEVFGNADLAKRWLEASHALLGETPLQRAISPEGLSQVVAILINIEHGLPV